MDRLLDRAFATIYDPFMAGLEAGSLGRLRRTLLADLAGEVVEIGAGTGASVPHYPATVERVTLCEPAPDMADRLRARLPAGDDRFRVVPAPAETLPLEDASVDHVVSTLVLCTVDDLDRTLAEARRVLRPGGSLVLVEHVVSEHPVARRVQRALTPSWRVLARGCRLDRDTLGALGRAGFDTTGVSVVDLPGVERIGRAVAGRATPQG